MSMQSVNEIFALDEGCLARSGQLIEQALGQLKRPQKEISRTRLTAETVLKRWRRAFPPDTALQLRIYKRFGYVRVVFRLAGSSVNPLRQSPGAHGFGLTGYEELLLPPMHRTISYSFHAGVNELEIKLPTFDADSMTFRIALAVVGALVCGTLGHLLLAPETAVLLAGEATAPLVKTMLGLLSGVAGAMIFISLVAAICNMGDISTFSQIGGRVLLQLTGRVALATAITLPLGLVVFDVVEPGSGVNLSILKDVYALVLKLVPRNMVAPFVQGDTMQIIMLALLTGYTVLLIGQKVRTLVVVVNELNDVIMSMLNTVCRLLPLIVFLSLFNLLLKGDMASLVKLWKIFAFNGALIALFLGGTLVYIARRCGLGLRQLASDVLPIFMLGATTMSSPPCLPLISRTCRQRYQAEENLCSFAIPFGQQLYMPYHAINMLCYLIGLADMFGLRFSLSTACMIFICCNIMVYTIPPIPMGIMTVLALMLSLAGIPAEGLAIAMSLDFIMAMGRMGAKVAGLTAEVIALDRSVK